MRTYFHSETIKGKFVELIFGAIPFVLMLTLSAVEKIGDLSAFIRVRIYYIDRRIALTIAKVLG